MALVKGTNCGFVASAPTANPGGDAGSNSTRAYAVKDVVPAGAGVITEIGWYAEADTASANFEVGIYLHNSGTDYPAALRSKSATNTKTSGIGWKVASGLNIPVTPGETLWIAIQSDVQTALDMQNDGSLRRAFTATGATTLNDPFGATFAGSFYYAIYALYAAAGGVAMPVMINQHRQRRG